MKNEQYYFQDPEKQPKAFFWVKKSCRSGLLICELNVAELLICKSQRPLTMFPGSWETGTGFSQPRVHT